MSRIAEKQILAKTWGLGEGVIIDTVLVITEVKDGVWGTQDSGKKIRLVIVWESHTMFLYNCGLSRCIMI